jgi:deoxyribonuclease-4
MAREQDILKRSAPKRPPRLTSRRIGIHTSSAGGVQNAAERAYRLGCNTFQMFSSSPRQWAPYELGELQCAEMNRLRAGYDLKPLVIHTNYLVNLASSNELFLRKSMQAFRGEVERALLYARNISSCIPARFGGPTASRDCCVPPPPSLHLQKGSTSPRAA